ncbi:MAG: serine hydrolase [Planctomycetes bacterium]|nr:serine hydrolase [Planctomycetota bacterium]
MTRAAPPGRIRAMRALILYVCALVFVGRAASAHQDALERRAREVAAIIAAEPKWADDLFDKAFLKEVPPARLRAIGLQYFAQCGEVTDVRLQERKTEHSAVFEMTFAKDQVATLTLGLGAAAPNSVVMLFFGVPTQALSDWPAVIEAFQKLPGSSNFAVWKLGAEKPEVLAAHEADRALAIGSAFKLYVLGALVDEIAAGKRKLSDVVTLDARSRSLPSGVLHAWPLGTPVTLASLAVGMISISDNTATDHLMAALSRDRVEAQLAKMGNENAARSLPFLHTHELFRLKAARNAGAVAEYLKLDLPGKRAFLAKEVAAWPLDESIFDGGFLTRPSYIEELEWFASAADLCRAMDWLRKATESGPASSLREVLAINRGLSVSTRAFPWAGFKGGSEPGVLDFTFLLRAADGSWYALSAAWNDPSAAVDEVQFAGLVQRAIVILGGKPAK